jgi:ABC-type microcin C transport system duplicated ATPase subunit YejF
MAATIVTMSEEEISKLLGNTISMIFKTRFTSLNPCISH